MGKAEVLSVLHELRNQQGLTIVLVEQDAEAVAWFSDRVAVLQAGRIVNIDQPERVFSNVEALDRIGIRVPQVSRIAHQLNRQFGTDFSFCTVAAGRETLQSYRKAQG